MRLSKKDFDTIRFSTIYRGRLFDVKKGESPSFKVSCVISKKTIKTATGRNVIRRKVLHAIREASVLENKTSALCVYPKKEIQEANYQDIVSEIIQAFATLR
jgi:ribonuclease P protein component